MSDANSIFALVVGINDYSGTDLAGDGELPEVANLHCAEPDAKNIRNFLVKSLHVPEANIATLYDKQATREGILSSFRTHLIENERIKKDDPILFYFAGHGTRYLDFDQYDDEFQDEDANNNYADTGGREEHMHEAICPADRRADVVWDIEDWELGDLLMELWNEKGDNITVIMDCCHSGSGTRSTPSLSANLRARFLPPLRHTRPGPTAAAQADHHRSVKTKPSILHSHVLLAACRSSEQAYEDGDSGWFTNKLSVLLKDPTLPSMSYSSLMNKIQRLKFEYLQKDETGRETQVWLTQTPQCEGKRKDALLFGGKALGVDKRLVRLKKKRDGRYQIKAGAIQGVTPDTRFVIQRDDRFSLDYLGEATATQVEAVSTYVDIRSKQGTSLVDFDDHVYYAKISYLVDPIYPVGFQSEASSSRQMAVEAGLHMLTETNRRGIDLHLVHADPAHARLVATVHKDRMELRLKSPLIEKIRQDHATTVAINYDPGDHGVYDLQRISWAARFDLYLHHENPDHPYRNQVTANLYKLRDHSRRNLAPAGIARLEDDPLAQAEYVLQLTNKTDVDLYPAAYYFDPSNHSVHEIYKAPTPNAGSSPLRRNSSFTIGSDESAVSPFYFYLAPGEDEDTGFLKVFLSERYAEMGIIEQSEDFTPVPASEREKDRVGDTDGEKASGSWDTITVTIKISRKAMAL